MIISLGASFFEMSPLIRPPTCLPRLRPLLSISGTGGPQEELEFQGDKWDILPLLNAAICILCLLSIKLELKEGDVGVG